MRLAPNIYVAWIGGRSVILDVSADRYLGLGGELSQALRRLATDPEAETAAELEPARAELLRRGLVAPGPPEPLSAPPPPCGSIWPGETLTPLAQPRGPAGTASVLRALAQVSLWLRTRRFAETLAAVAAARPAGRRPPSAQVLVDSYHAARPLYPVKPICRLDAPARCLHFRRHGRPASLVFGVRLDPFVAHCWAQEGDLVMAEAHDRIAQYTPILAI